MVWTSRVLVCVSAGLLAPSIGLRAQDVENRTEARGEDAFKSTLARLSSKEAAERVAAAEDLGRRGYRFRKPIAETMRPMLLWDPDASVRAAVGRALGRLGSREALPELTRALEDTSPEVRAVAAAALWRLPEPSALPALIARTKDEDAKVREWSALALGVIADASALQPLVSLLADPERAVRLAAVRSIGRLDRSQALPSLEAYLAADKRDEEEKDEVVNAVAGIHGSERVASLLALYAAAASDVTQKRRLLTALARVGDAQALPMLRKLSTQREDGRGLRAPAVAAYNAVLSRVGAQDGGL